MRYSIILFILLTCIEKLPAQETWGISNSNYAGNMGIGLNPSSIVAAPYSYEFNLLSVDLFAENNYIYLKKGFGLFNNATYTGESGSGKADADYYTATPLKKAYASTLVMLPSYIRNFGNKAWGVHLSHRTVVSLEGIPHHLAKFIYEGFNYEPQHGINFTSGAFDVAVAGWWELGGTYAKRLGRASDEHVLKAGITANLLLGTDAIYMKVSSVDYIVPSNGLLIVNSMNAQYGHALPEDYKDGAGYFFAIRGIGFSGNAGITYINHYSRKAHSCDQATKALKKYNYRIGLSLMDVGMINYNSLDTRTFNISNRSAYWPGIDTMKFRGWDNLDTILSNRFYGNPVASSGEKYFTMFLPAAASLQFDYNFKPFLFLNLTIVQRIPLNKISVLRPNQVSLTPRFEKRKFELAMPVSFYDYNKFALGFAVRAGIFFAGTDRLLTFTGLTESTGFDLFFGIKWTNCKTKVKKIRGCFAV